MKLILSILLVLIIPILAMSGGSNQDPNKITVKDQFGIDTGMTQAELDEFKNRYFVSVKNNGFLENIVCNPDYKERYINTRTDEFYNNKLNLNEINYLKKLKLFHVDYSSDHDMEFAYIMSDASVILIGTSVGKEYLYETLDEEKATYDFKSRYLIEVEEILKGNEWFVNPPDTIGCLSSIGQFITNTSMDFELNKKYIMFLKPIDMLRKENGDFYRSSQYAIRIEKNGLFWANAKNSKYYFDLDEIKKRINTFIKINNSENFYRRKYK